MRAPHGYTMQKALRAGADRQVQLATRADGTEVVLKTSASRARPEAALRLRQEFENLRKVAGPGIPVEVE